MSASFEGSTPLRPEPPPAFRWLVLVVISFAMFGNYYIYDSISPLADVLVKQLGFSDANIGLLNSIYSIPNIIMVLIGGIIIDRIGTKKSILIFAALCLAGAVLTASSSGLLTMAAGRLVFGLGAESLIVAVTTSLARWFKGKELSFAFGLNLTIARLGSFAALNSPTWARPMYDHWQLPLLLSVGAGVISVVAAVLYFFQDGYASRKYTLASAGETDKVALSDIFKFGTSYWYVVALCVTFYSAMFPFQTFAVKFFQDAHGVTRETGGFLSSMLTLFAMIFTPLFGLMADKIGKRALLMMFGSVLIMPVYLVMGYTHMSLFIPMAVMGIAFSLVPAIMWPSVTYLVDGSRLGTAYGMMTMIQNIGLAGFNLLIGYVNDASGASASNAGGYVNGMWVFSILGFCGLFFAFMLRRRETGPHGHGLETITTKTGA